MKILSTKLTSLIMVIRDQMKQDVVTLKLESEAAFKIEEELAKSILFEAKKKVHISRIKINSMEKEIETLQEALSEEIELEIKETNKTSSDWNIKSNASLIEYLIEVK